MNQFEASPLQGTMGKIVCGIKVIDEDGNRLTFLLSVWRNLAKLIVCISLGIGFFWAAISETKRAWHDQFVRTFVIVR